ncbi:MAG TPA: hypothetical protein VK141_05245 [Nitrosomonas sp.]|nr:hypothetical protein [Nitrosomonas sp.]
MEDGEFFDGKDATAAQNRELKIAVCRKIMQSDAFLVTTMKDRVGSVSMHNLNVGMLPEILDRQIKAVFDIHGQLSTLSKAKELLK